MCDLGVLRIPPLIETDLLREISFMSRAAIELAKVVLSYGMCSYLTWGHRSIIILVLEMHFNDSD